MNGSGRSLWAYLHLLDRQLLDRDGRPVAKVDDLVISEPDNPSELPVVTAMLCGPAALGRRFGPRLGSMLEALRGVTCPESPEPASISMDLVTDIGPALELSARREELPVNDVEEFLADHVVAHIPGAGERGASEEGGEEI
jgi:hypothetical protein